MFGRFPIRDWSLLFLCGWILAHAHWPSGKPVRVITYFDTHGQRKQCSLEVNDPQLGHLQQRLRDWQQPQTPISLVIAKWRLDLADHYCRDWDRKQPTDPPAVVQVAFETNQSVPPSSVHPDATYWQTVRSQMVRWIADAEGSLASASDQGHSPPITIGPVQPGGKGIVGMLMSAVLGAMLATGFCLWSFANPAISLRAPAAGERRTSHQRLIEETGDPICLQIPAEWVRVHQPPAVVARRILYLCVVVAATATQLTVGL